MAKVAEIIDALGGAKAISDKIGVPLTTIHSWKRVGNVPPWRIPMLVGLMTKDGRKIAASDFLTPAKPVQSEARAAA